MRHFIIIVPLTVSVYKTESFVVHISYYSCEFSLGFNHGWCGYRSRFPLKSSKSNFHATVVNALHALRLVHKTGVLYLTRHQDVCFFRKLRWLQSALYGINCSMVSGVLRRMPFEGEFTNCGDLKLPKIKGISGKKIQGGLGVITIQ